MECGSVKRTEETDQYCQDCEPSRYKVIPAPTHRPPTQVIPPTQKGTIEEGN